MREATKEERESVNNYIKSISQKVITIPDGATNGDIIKALFPKIDDYFSNIIDLKLWWNAKYKAESEDEE